MPESSAGAVVTIKDIYDTVMETKFAVLGLDAKVENINNQVKDHDKVLDDHDNKLDDLYKKWYMVGGVGGFVGSAIVIVAEIIFKTFHLG